MNQQRLPKVQVRKSEIEGKGLFTLQAIRRGEIVDIWECVPARVVSIEEAFGRKRNYGAYDFQVDHNRMLIVAAEEDISDGDYMNHSCEPNCGMRGSFQMVAMRDIKAGEELTYDYAMTDSYEYKMECICNAPICRGVVTGEDWKMKSLQEKYYGFFSRYLQEEIERLTKPNVLVGAVSAFAARVKAVALNGGK